MKKILLINPPYYGEIYNNTVVRVTLTPGVIVLGLASVASPLIKQGHTVKILDLNITREEPVSALKKELQSFSPDFVGITFTTPLTYIAVNLCNFIKSINNNIIVVGGGPHCSSMPSEVLACSDFDAVIIGEGEYSFSDIVNGINFKNITGIAYKEGGKPVLTPKREPFVKLDDLPYPSLELFDIPQYIYPKITAKKNPVASMETSRGCFAQCTYCNKSIFGYKFRFKTPKRVVDEMEHILGLGFGEIHIVDDGFSTDIKRAIEICREIKTRKLKFPWYVRGGMRVDKVTYELLREMKEAGCYHIPYGIESGSQRIIDRIKKGITLKQVENAVKWAKQLGFIVDGYFMMGLPGETEEDLEKTIKFAKSLNFDFAKFAITIPLPNTELFNEIESSGRLKTKEWAKYTFSTVPRKIYQHDTLSWDTLEKYYDKAYKTFYFRPIYIVRSLFNAIKHGTMLEYIKAFFSFIWQYLSKKGG